ncbi:MAG: CxxxxCH/CxxCH domain-containing protein [Geobacteraceae bacterium]|nr:CxxxxCH/CxxCH domain-containing protein [Geobacteraceae bacterium]
MERHVIGRCGNVIKLLAAMAALTFLPVISHAGIQCYDCHGTSSPADIRPVDAETRNIQTGGFKGNHRRHLKATTDSTACTPCHPGSSSYTSSHRDGMIKLAGNINSSPQNALYKNSSSQFPQSSAPTTGSCSNVNCHFENNTPTWGSPPLTSLDGCSTCHGNPPNDGSHPALSGSGKKHGDYYGTSNSCSRCHGIHSNFDHVSAAGKRSLVVQFSAAPNSSGSYSGDLTYPAYLPSQHIAPRNGSCSNLYCHSDARGGAANIAPAWGGSLPGDCSGCHGGNRSSYMPISSGNHKRHITSSIYCGSCHFATLSPGDDRTIVSIPNHVNGTKNVLFSDGGSFDQVGKSCSGIYCHGATAPVWGSGALASDCTGCHGGDAVSASLISSGKHAAHLLNISTLGSGNGFGCATCHAKTVSSNRIVISAAHANKLKDYSGVMAGKIAVQGSGQCSSNYCHSSGTRQNRFWSMTGANWYSERSLGCNGCHGTPALPDGIFASFTSLAGEPNYANMTAAGQRNSHKTHTRGGRSVGTTICTSCHASTVDASIAGRLRSYSTSHLNRAIDVKLAAAIQGSYSANAKSCLNTYCHGSTPSPEWGGATPACNGCHSAEGSGFAARGAGAHSLHYQSTVMPEKGSYGAMPAASLSTESSYTFTCSSCHTAPAEHANGRADKESGAAAQVYFGYTTKGMKGSYRYGAAAQPVTDNGFSWSGGSCISTYCHSSGNGGFANITGFSWKSGQGVLGTDCSGCHGGNRTSRYPIATAAHTAHINNDAVIGVSLSCTECHAKTVSADRTVQNRRLHVNRLKDYSGASAGQYDSAAKVCNNLYCHSNGKTGTSVALYQTPPAWNSGITLGCNGCHGTGTPEGAPDYASGAAASATANSHPGHASANRVAANISCTVCHYETAASGSALRTDQNPSRHINKNSADVYFNQSGSYSGAGKSCTTIYCHSSGLPFDKTASYKQVIWGDASLTCSSCHDTGGAVTALSGRHGKHTDKSRYGFGCERCHSRTAADDATINEKPLHVNHVKNVDFKDGGSYASDRGCNSSYCHSGAFANTPLTPVNWADTDKTMKCFSCHRGRTIDSNQQNCEAILGNWSASRQVCSPELTMGTDGHERLVSMKWIRKYPCTYCHTGTVPAKTPIIGKPPIDDTDNPVYLGSYSSGKFIPPKHVNGVKDIAINSFWKIDGNRNSYPLPSYNPATKSCNNLYCHSDGTTDPATIKELRWTAGKRTACNGCHGHSQGECRSCHNGTTVSNGKVLAIYSGWKPGEEWKSAMPMFANEGVNMPRANSHARHLETSFSCSECHAQTVVNGDCIVCHRDGATGTMSETAHLNPAKHVNKIRDVDFLQGGIYNFRTTGVKSCSNTKCHGSSDPVWGMSVNSEVICLSCHGNETLPDQDDFGSFNNIQARINMPEWRETGHGRTAAKGNYKSGNPPAAFPATGNPCWYCHDNGILHKDASNPFRLKMHNQFNNRFDHECVYCHMSRTEDECRSCHNSIESLAPQLANISSSRGATDKWLDGTQVARPDHRNMQGTSCMTDSGTLCHSSDMRTHNTNAGIWSTDQKNDVKNQYMMMGVCLQCHDDDSGGKCNGCHSATDSKYQLGYNPGSGYIKPVKARASSVHFGHKHYQGFISSGGWDWDPNRYGVGKGGYKGTWKGGKFCWDCHDPHGDSNIYMIHDKVATETDGKFGIPIPEKRATVKFTQKNTGADYAKSSGTIDGICNVCHTSGSQHYRNDGGDGHNSSYVCTKCHEHRFSDSHGGGQSCSKCHQNKPVPRHSAFGLPRDCTKCHTGNVGARVDIMGQFKGNSHHVQGVTVTNEQCYQCHFEATEQGLIDTRYHEGYNYKTYSTVKNAKVDLVIYGAGSRPTTYRLTSTAQGRATAVQFSASKVSSPDINTERKEIAKITAVCIGCHSDQNNDTTPFNDCKTPRQYAWDRQSIASRYQQTDTARWSNYSNANTNKKSKITKAMSAHGNAAANQGGWDPTTGVDANIANSRAGFSGMSSARQNVQCFDCHNSHGSKATGVTASYLNFSGSYNGGNLKEVTAGKGGYTMTYSARGKVNGSGVVNPFNAGAGQCFDCHMTNSRGTTPWGYNSTFGATQPIKGYRDGLRFGSRTSAMYQLGTEFKKSKQIVGGHLKASGTDQGQGPTTQIMGTINGLCTPCHDPHGISPSLGSSRVMAIPLLKDTWLTSPYKEDQPPPAPYGSRSTPKSWGGITPGTGPSLPYDTQNDKWYRYNTDKTTFGSGKIAETDEQFAGLCLRCHPKKSLLGSYTGAVNSSTNASKAPWKSVARVHASVKDWGKNKISGEHSNPCSKCHQPHNSGLPRLMQTDCLNYNHRKGVQAGGQAMRSIDQAGGNATGHGQYRGYPSANLLTSTVENEASISCHSGATNNSGTWPDKNLWNRVTPW